MKFILPVESIVQNKGGVILYDPDSNEILKQYVHDKQWKRNGWRGGKLHGDVLIATDWTDLHYFNVKEWKYLKSFTKKTFNDLHYVEIHGKKMYVVNTGLDAIEIFRKPMNPEFERIEFVFNKNTSLFQKRKIDLRKSYNKELKIKPHSCHPNCISFDKKRIFVTCFAKNQKINSGEVIELNSGKRLFKRNYDCHDGIYHGNDFYLTLTRAAKILIFENLYNTSVPMVPSRQINIKRRGWWRGMVIYNNFLYVFASDGYKKKKTTVALCKINLKTEEQHIQKLPVVDDVHWDTVYQPNIYEV